MNYVEVTDIKTGNGVIYTIGNRNSAPKRELNHQISLLVRKGSKKEDIRVQLKTCK